jgi:transcriptional adapter 3
MPGQKGPGKKGSRADSRQSRSRNTTPSSFGAGTVAPTSDATETLLTELPIKAFSTYDGFDVNATQSIPDSRGLEIMIEQLEALTKIAETRGVHADRGMRGLAILKKDKLKEMEMDEQRTTTRREDGEESRKRKKDSSRAKDRPLTHGAHAAAPQDGSNLGKQPVSGLGTMAVMGLCWCHWVTIDICPIYDGYHPSQVLRCHHPHTLYFLFRILYLLRQC